MDDDDILQKSEKYKKPRCHYRQKFEYEPQHDITLGGANPNSRLQQHRKNRGTIIPQRDLIDTATSEDDITIEGWVYPIKQTDVHTGCRTPRFSE